MYTRVQYPCYTTSLNTIQTVHVILSGVLFYSMPFCDCFARLSVHVQLASCCTVGISQHQPEQRHDKKSAEPLQVQLCYI